MENVKASAKKIMVNYGILLGIITVLFNVILYVTNNHLQPHWSLSILGFFLSIVLIYMGIKAFKKENDGYLKLGEALKIGLGIALITAVIGVIYTYLLMNVIEPTYMDQVLELQQEAMLERNPDMPQEQMDMAIEMSQKFSGSGVVMAVQLIAGLFFGFIISLVCGLILKKDNPYAEA